MIDWNTNGSNVFIFTLSPDNAFDLDFDIEGIQQYFLDYLASGKTANVSLDSYQDLLKEFRSHSAHFYMQKGAQNGFVLLFSFFRAFV